MAFFGDGATEEGVFTESLNFASLHKLPVLFVCENNDYAIHTPITQRWATQRLCERVATYGIAGRCIEDGDVLELREVCSRHGYTATRAARVRIHRVPHLSLARARRPERGLRRRLPRACGGSSRGLQSDQIGRLGALLRPIRGSASKAIEREIEDAVAFAESSPFPTPAGAYTNVFAEQ